MNKRSITTMIKCFVLLILLMPAWLAWDVSPAQGANFLVTRFDDPTPGACDSDCSLREAIIQANSTPALDEIYLPEGTYNLTRVGMDNNAAAGDLDLTNPVYIWGFGAPETVVINGTGTDRVFEIIGSPGTVTIESVKITNGLSPTLNGGGIACANSTLVLEYVFITSNDAPANNGGGLSSDGCTVTMNATKIIDNYAHYGGGIYARTSTYTITNSDISSNFAFTGGGGIHSYNSNISLFATSVNWNISEGVGGGLSQLGSNAILSIDKSLVANNVADSDGGGMDLIEGSNLSIINSTISNNVTDAYGGGISTRIPSTITHSTIVLNSADFDMNGAGGGGGIDAYSGTAVVGISHTVLANNHDFSASYENDCHSWSGATINSNGYNLVRTPAACTFNTSLDILGQDPKLGPLQDNGGWTDTHALLIGSPAIDAGDLALTTPPAPSTDQRGPSRFARIINGRVDIGAFEAWLGYFLPAIFR